MVAVVEDNVDEAIIWKLAHKCNGSVTKPHQWSQPWAVQSSPEPQGLLPAELGAHEHECLPARNSPGVRRKEKQEKQAWKLGYGQLR